MLPRSLMSRMGDLARALKLQLSLQLSLSLNTPQFVLLGLQKLIIAYQSFVQLILIVGCLERLFPQSHSPRHCCLSWDLIRCSGARSSSTLGAITLMVERMAAASIVGTTPTPTP